MQLSGEEWRHRQGQAVAAGHVQRRTLEAWVVQPEPLVQAGGLWDLGAGSSHPQPQLPAFFSQSISWQRKKKAEDRRQARLAGGGGT